MPIFEYVCNDCANEFEILTFGGEKIVCEKCGGASLTKKFSAFAVGSSTKGDSQIPYCPSGACSSAGMGGCPAMGGMGNTGFSGCGCSGQCGH